MRARIAPPKERPAPEVAPPQRRAAGVLALQQTAGNRAVGKLLRRRVLARRTSAEAMDLARGAAKTHTLWDREYYLYARLTDPGEAQRADQCLQLRAVEKLELATREKQFARQTLDPDVEERIKTRKEAIRLIAWKGSAKEGIQVAMEKAKTPMDYVQVGLLTQDLDALKREFRFAAYDNAYKLLDESARRIGDMLRSYGLMTAHAEPLVRNVTFGYESSGKAVAEWLSYAKSLDPWKTKETAAHRSGLTKAAAHVRALRKDYERELDAYAKKYESKDFVSQVGKYWLALPARLRVTKATTDAQRADLEVVKAKHAAAAAAQIEAEREHPLLAAYRDRKLDDLASTKGDDAVEEVVDTSIDTLSNILMAKLALKQHKVSALELGPIVALTRAQLLIRQGTYWDAAISDLIHEETDGNKFAMAVLQVVLAALALLPGGQVFALLGLGLDLWTAGNELAQYGLDTTLAGTDLDRAKALSDKTPSLTGFVFALVSAGLNAAAVRSALKEAEALGGKIASGDKDAVDALNKLGKEHGVEHLGEDVAKRVHNEPRPHEPPPKKKPAEPEGGKPAEREGKPVREEVKPKVEPPKLRVKGLKYTSAEEVRADVVKRLKGGTAKSKGKMPEDYGRVHEALAAHPGTANAQIKELVDTVMGALRTPENYADVLAEAWTRAAKVDGDINTALREMAAEAKGGKVIPISEVPAGQGLLHGEVFFEKYVSKESYFVDNALLGDDHGAMTHLLQDLVVDRALKAAGKDMTSAEFRALLGRAEGTLSRDAWETLRAKTFLEYPDGFVETELKTGDYVWRLTYDLAQDGYLPMPEMIGRALKKALGLK
jgi:hypothetical protein